ncbi:hypothetical protein C1O66_01420 [Paucibacter aquatile]|jgi:hypothetical protein|uniref:Ice-binding protein C-terminal domain-containing protein n=1 Tax=Kinneretia aquatilis TaxID=2070761 RepID=A0A2N8L308_9BURK|nr:PEP-CTERM sorting domain-containing protein [Paucibacter aquatile]PND40080.1 hypothetical protein C1O66_01420 [Paucibacter aquatile]
MKALKTLVASTLIAVTAPLMANPVLDFQVGGFATQSLFTNNPYASSNISFSQNALNVASSYRAGGEGNFFQSPVTAGESVRALFVGNANSVDIFVNDHFDDELKFSFTTNPTGEGKAVIYGDVDANGNRAELGSVVLGSSGADCKDENGDIVLGYVCVWKSESLRGFTGASLIRLTASSGDFYFDNIELGRGSSNVPEPTSIALSLAALGALALSRKRKPQA